MGSFLLVQPEFPKHRRSKNHSDFLPIGLLKIATYLRNNGDSVALVIGEKEVLNFVPDEIFITSLFTYWSNFVKSSVEYYRKQFPNSKITVGGIYATLLPEHCKTYTKCDEVFVGLFYEAEFLMPAYDLVDVNYQIIHGMRGCFRKCPFCGIWKLENLSFKNENQIQKEICRNKIIFYDNNLLLNPNINEILLMLASQTLNGRPIKCESQSGFDGRILVRNPHLATLLKNARFSEIRLAWDFSFEQFAEVEKWIRILESGGYKRSQVYIFMIYNWSFDYQELEMKRRKCFEWGVQVADCRFRPLDVTIDNYNPQLKQQSNEDYYIHSNWTDNEIRQFRRDVRKHNICLRYKIEWNAYEKQKEREFSKGKLKKVNLNPALI